MASAEPRLSLASKVIRAFSAINREIATLAISDEREIDGTSAAWVAFHAASVEWNAARHEAALIAPVNGQAQVPSFGQVKVPTLCGG